MWFRSEWYPFLNSDAVVLNPSCHYLCDQYDTKVFVNMTSLWFKVMSTNWGLPLYELGWLITFYSKIRFCFS